MGHLLTFTIQRLVVFPAGAELHFYDPQTTGLEYQLRKVIYPDGEEIYFDAAGNQVKTEPEE